MKISQKTENEMVALARSESFRNDMEILSMRDKSPFIKGGMVDVDAYIEFVNMFNQFINHEPKPFEPMVEKEMKL